MLRRIRIVILGILLVGLGALDIHAQAGAPDAVARAFFDALSGGKPEQFEAMAQERFAPALLARRTPAERAQMVERIRGDFGTMTLGGIRNVNDGQVTLVVRGSTGMAGRIQLSFEPAPPYRITLLAIEVGDQDDGPAGPPPPPINGGMTRADLDRALDAYLAARASADEFAGVVAIAKNGKLMFQRAYGLANREAKMPVMVSTRFNVASIGKAFTKTAIGQLVAQGRLALTDTIGKWLPDCPNPKARAATVDQLLNHQAGIADFFGPAFNAAPKSQFASNADYYRFVSAQPLLFDPGTNRQYCNGCYVVLGEIIAKVSGQAYEDYVTEHVFKPAVMFGAGFFRSDRLPAAVAQQYSKQLPGSQGALQNAREAHGVTGSAAGGAYASAGDLLAFDDAIRTGKLLDPKMTAWFLETEPAAAAAGARARGGIGVAGGAPGANALLETDEQWAVAVVGNLDPPASVGVGQAIKRALAK
jgi:D-alanyl-D-alanine carboxypeptidase